MPINLQEFVSRVALDTLKKSRFDVTIMNLRGVGAASLQQAAAEESTRGMLRTLEQIRLRCETCSLPGLQILTKDLKLFGGMPNLKVPSGREQDDIDFTFISSGLMQERKFLEEWLFRINNFSTNNVAYFNDITADIAITVYNESDPIAKVNSRIASEKESAPPGEGGEFVKGVNGGWPVYTVTLVNAYPIRVETLPMSWEDTDQLLKFTATFTYEQLKFEAKDYKHDQKVFEK